MTSSYATLMRPWGDSTDNQRWKTIKGDRYRIQLGHESNYRIALVEIMSELRETEGPVMSEAFQTEIRNWFYEVK
jgi:hypothetical protein